MRQTGTILLLAIAIAGSDRLAEAQPSPDELQLMAVYLEQSLRPQRPAPPEEATESTDREHLTKAAPQVSAKDFETESDAQTALAKPGPHPLCEDVTRALKGKQAFIVPATLALPLYKTMKEGNLGASLNPEVAEEQLKRFERTLREHGVKEAKIKGISKKMQRGAINARSWAGVLAAGLGMLAVDEALSEESIWDKRVAEPILRYIACTAPRTAKPDAPNQPANH